jgi:hypothetical protein
MEPSSNVWRFAALGGLLLAVGLGLAWWSERSERAALQASHTRLTREAADLRYEAKQSTGASADYQQAARQLDTQLADAKSRQTAAEIRAEELIRRVSAGDEQLGKREKRIASLIEEIDRLKSAAAGATGGTAAEVADRDQATAQRIADLEARVIDLLSRALAEPAPTSVPGPPGWQVVRVGPRDSFVITDYGARAGAAVNQQLVITRGTTVVARVQITDVRADFSVARVSPPGAKAQLQPGDFALLEQ